jgi:cytosylglucuronate decarboxylase
METIMRKGKYLFVRVLEACNADCFMCGFALSRDSYRLSPGELTGILGQAVKKGVQYVRFTGGEPLMHREILELIRVSTTAGARVSLITNGYSLSAMAASLAQAGLDQVIVSIDAAEAEQHDYYRNTKGLFDRAWAGMADARRHGIRLRVNTVVGPHNYRGMPDLGRHLKEAGVGQWELSALKLSSDIVYDDPADVIATGDRVFAGDGLVPMGKRWYGDTAEEQQRYFVQGIPPRPSSSVCRVTEDVMYLDAKEGQLFPCSLLPHRSTPALYGGRIRTEDGSVDLDSPSFTERRDFFHENGPIICTGCSSSAAGYSDTYAGSDEEPPAWAY